MFGPGGCVWSQGVPGLGVSALGGWGGGEVCSLGSTPGGAWSGGSAPGGGLVSQHARRQTLPPGETATAADGTHPTGMHSCFMCFILQVIVDSVVRV